jgi:16S rRNA (cytosine1402-N4)-methyltransferase
LRRRSGAEAAGSRHAPLVGRDGPAPTFDKADKAVRPSAAELTRNPRSRSATLRSATRTHAAAWAAGGLAA